MKQSVAIVAVNGLLIVGLGILLTLKEPTAPKELPHWIVNVAWLATLACTFLAVHGATACARRSPRVFAALALFAMNWAVLLPYYGETSRGGNETLNAF